jgi:rare lipoprotein A
MMRTIQTTMTAVAFATLTAIGCAPADDPDPAADAASPPEWSVEPISGSALAALQEEYPRLGETPLPEPSPSADATPEQVPERVRRNLPGRVLERVTGPATFYADKFEGRRTASGIPFRQNQMVAAHRAYPFGTVLRVTNPRNDRAVTVRVVDRGPFARPAGAERPVIDLSRRAAQQIGIIEAGRAPVQIEVLEWGQGVAS